MTADLIYFESFNLLQIAKDAKDRTLCCEPRKPQACFSDAITAIVFSAVAAEAFVNELKEHAEESCDLGNRPEHESARASLRALAAILVEVEEARGSTLLKALWTSRVLCGDADKGKQPFQDLATLLDIRNAIVHSKPVAPKPSIIQSLSSRHCTAVIDGSEVKLDSESPITWLESIATRATAEWAVSTVSTLLLHIVKLIPKPYQGWIGLAVLGDVPPWLKEEVDVAIEQLKKRHPDLFEQGPTSPP